jgi:hypothetical protein
MYAGDRLPLRRTPLAWAGGLTALLFAGAVWPVAPLRDAATGAAADAHLRLSPAFLALAPLNNTLDALSLLSVREHLTVLVVLAAVFVAWRVRRRVRHGARRGGRIREVGAAGIALGGLLALYATGALVARPMAALELPPQDSDQVTIDFHSHTNASHDGRPGFTPARNRSWHAAAGFDVAYISDHFTFAGAEIATRENPARAGAGTVLLSAIESLEGGEHVNVLGATATDYALFHGRYVAAAAVESAIAAGRSSPVIVQTIPGTLSRLPKAGMSDVVPVSAIEISDAAPRGLSDSDRDRTRILGLADSLGLAIVAGSDNHGWGRTAAAWSVMRIPGWRTLTPDDLEHRVEDAIRTEGRRAVRVVERTRPEWPTRAAAGRPGGWVSSAAGAPGFLITFVWQLFATRSTLERVSWLAWVWCITLLVAWCGRQASAPAAQ